MLLFQAIRTGDWFITVDIHDGHFHIPVSPDHRQFFRFAFLGRDLELQLSTLCHRFCCTHTHLSFGWDAKTSACPDTSWKHLPCPAEVSGSSCGGGSHRLSKKTFPWANRGGLSTFSRWKQFTWPWDNYTGEAGHVGTDSMAVFTSIKCEGGMKSLSLHVVNAL